MQKYGNKRARFPSSKWNCIIIDALIDEAGNSPIVLINRAVDWGHPATTNLGRGNVDVGLGYYKFDGHTKLE